MNSNHRRFHNAKHRNELKGGRREAAKHLNKHNIVMNNNVRENEGRSAFWGVAMLKG